MHDQWRPACTSPRDLVPPVPIDPSGRAGPTRPLARRGRWRAVAHNLYVPTPTDSSRVEQRIIEQAARVGSDGAVTGWAALRIWGAAFFDGDDSRTGARLPVPLLSPHHLTSTADSTASRALPGPIWRVAGIPVVGPASALASEIRRRGELRAAVAAIDMACAAPVTSLARFGSWLRTAPGPRALCLRALALADEEAASPPEVAMRLVWVLDAGWATPLVNRDVFDLRGRFLGRPDLLDPDSGVCGEYSGAHHRSRERHRADVTRFELMRQHGLEPFEMVAGDEPAVQLERMEAARRRAAGRRSTERSWCLEPPGGAVRRFTADEVVEHRRIPT